MASTIIVKNQYGGVQKATKSGNSTTYTDYDAQGNIVKQRTITEAGKGQNVFESKSNAKNQLQKSLESGTAGDVVRAGRELAAEGESATITTTTPKDNTIYLNDKGQGFSAAPSLVPKSIIPQPFGRSEVDYYSGRKEIISTGMTDVYGKNIVTSSPVFTSSQNSNGKIQETIIASPSFISRGEDVISEYGGLVFAGNVENTIKTTKGALALIQTKNIPYSLAKSEESGLSYSQFEKFKDIGKTGTNIAVAYGSSYAFGGLVGKGATLLPAKTLEFVSSKPVSYTLGGLYIVGVSKEIASSKTPIQTGLIEMSRLGGFTGGTEAGFKSADLLNPDLKYNFKSSNTFDIRSVERDKFNKLVRVTTPNSEDFVISNDISLKTVTTTIKPKDYVVKYDIKGKGIKGTRVVSIQNNQVGVLDSYEGKNILGRKVRVIKELKQIPSKSKNEFAFRLEEGVSLGKSSNFKTFNKGVVTYPSLQEDFKGAIPKYVPVKKGKNLLGQDVIDTELYDFTPKKSMKNPSLFKTIKQSSDVLIKEPKVRKGGKFASSFEQVKIIRQGDFNVQNVRTISSKASLEKQYVTDVTTTAGLRISKSKGSRIAPIESVRGERVIPRFGNANYIDEINVGNGRVINRKYPQRISETLVTDEVIVAGNPFSELSSKGARFYKGESYFKPSTLDIIKVASKSKKGSLGMDVELERLKNERFIDVPKATFSDINYLNLKRINIPTELPSRSIKPFSILGRRVDNRLGLQNKLSIIQNYGSIPRKEIEVARANDNIMRVDVRLNQKSKVDTILRQNMRTSNVEVLKPISKPVNPIIELPSFVHVPIVKGSSISRFDEFKFKFKPKKLLSGLKKSGKFKFGYAPSVEGLYFKIKGRTSKGLASTGLFVRPLGGTS